VERDGGGYRSDLGQAASVISEIPNSIGRSVCRGVERKGSAYGQSDANDPGCVKTPTANLRVEIFVSITLNGKRTALAAAVEGGKGENNSAHSLLAHVFTQPGPIADLSVVCVDGQPKHAIEGCLAAQLFAANRA
jgi:hypothetical protein